MNKQEVQELIQELHMDRYDCQTLTLLDDVYFIVVVGKL